MIVTQWALLATGAFILSLIFLLYHDAPLFAAGGLATILWSAAALTAPGLTAISNGSRLAVGSPVLAFVSLAFAAVSALATLGYRTGHYPPQPRDSSLITDD